MKKRGKGIAAAFYPCGSVGGGDPSQAMIKMKIDGSADLYIGSIDIGQGVQTVMAQIAAEELGLHYEQIKVHSGDSDTSPMCMGTFGSRVTYVCGNAVINAAKEVKNILFETVAPKLNADIKELTVSNGQIVVRSDATRSINIADAVGIATFGLGKLVLGRGVSLKSPLSNPDPETGACEPTLTMSYGAAFAEVEVDTETGIIEVLKFIFAYDVGRIMNPLLAEGQIEGGACMGYGEAIMENLMPNYPSIDPQPSTLGEYIIPTTMDIPPIEFKMLEFPSSGGPYGAKGMGEFVANPQSPAIVNAVFDAIGIWFNEVPLTPDRVLMKLDNMGYPKEK